MFTSSILAGGGTWGLVTSMVLQLHEYQPLEMVSLVNCIPEELKAISLYGSYGLVDGEINPDYYDILKPVIDLQVFSRDFAMNPSALGITVEQSARCSG